jgi:acetyl-CoA carboxylase carboxyltransferase component
MAADHVVGAGGVMVAELMMAAVPKVDIVVRGADDGGYSGGGGCYGCGGWDIG